MKVYELINFDSQVNKEIYNLEDCDNIRGVLYESFEEAQRVQREDTEFQVKDEGGELWFYRKLKDISVFNKKLQNNMFVGDIIAFYMVGNIDEYEDLSEQLEEVYNVIKDNEINFVSCIIEREVL